jgi:5-hydroxyisourate hydrolase-like protein (transthyretin family)
VTLNTVETRSAATPLWLRLRDTYTGRPPADVDVVLERRLGGDWVVLHHPHQISSQGDLGFLNLGRGPWGSAGTFDVRVTCSAPHTVVETSSGGPTLETTVTIWTDQSPPVPTLEPVSFFPAPDYTFSPSTPLLTGRVVDGAGDPVDRARVQVTETVGAATVIEEVRTTSDGWFRLPLRWSTGITQVDADKSGLTDSVSIVVPDDLRSLPTLTLT